MTSELAYVAATYPGKKVGVTLNFSPYGYRPFRGRPTVSRNTSSTRAASTTKAPQLRAAAKASLNWYKNNPTCLGYFTRMINAYGAAMD